MLLIATAIANRLLRKTPGKSRSLTISTRRPLSECGHALFGVGLLACPREQFTLQLQRGDRRSARKVSSCGNGSGDRCGVRRDIVCHFRAVSAPARVEPSDEPNPTLSLPCRENPAGSKTSIAGPKPIMRSISQIRSASGMTPRRLKTKPSFYHQQRREGPMPSAWLDPRRAPLIAAVRFEHGFLALRAAAALGRSD